MDTDMSKSILTELYANPCMEGLQKAYDRIHNECENASMILFINDELSNLLSFFKKLNDDEKCYLYEMFNYKTFNTVGNVGKLDNYDSIEIELISIFATYNDFNISTKYLNTFERSENLNFSDVLNSLANDDFINNSLFDIINESQCELYRLENDLLDAIIVKGRVEYLEKMEYIVVDYAHIIQKNYRQCAEFGVLASFQFNIDKFKYCELYDDDFWISNIVGRLRNSVLISLLNRDRYCMHNGTIHDKCKYFNGLIKLPCSIQNKIINVILTNLKEIEKIEYAYNEDNQHDEENIEESLLFWENNVLNLYSSYFQYSLYWHEYYWKFGIKVIIDLRVNPHELHKNLNCAKKILEIKLKQYIPEIINLILLMVGE